MFGRRRGVLCVLLLIYIIWGQHFHPVTHHHRRRIKTEERAKVVAADWDMELIQFLAALAILHQDDLKKG